MKKESRMNTVDHGKHVVLIGVGNIGSQIVPHIARMKNVARATLIDDDRYAKRNLYTQNIVPGDIDRPKAEVQARRLSQINPDIHVEAVIDRIENVAIGRLKSDVICTGLDSLGARQIVNERAHLLGIPWIDTAVGGADRLARISVFQPGEGRVCLECDWDARQYSLLHQKYACDEEPNKPPPTNASSSLGAIAASLCTLECEKIISGEHDLVSFGREVYMDLAHHKFYVSTLPINVNCRFPGHRSSPIDIGKLETVSLDSTIGRLFERVNPQDRNRAGNPHGTFSVPGQMFVTQLTCPRCGTRRSFPHLRVSYESSSEDGRTCCGRRMVAAGFDDTNELRVSSLSPETIACTLENLGVRVHDIVRIRTAPGEIRYFEAACEEVDNE